MGNNSLYLYLKEKLKPKGRSEMTKWHHSPTLAGNPNGRTHYDIGGDDCSNVCLVYPSEDGDADTLRKASLIAAAPETAAERDRLKESNACLLEAAKIAEAYLKQIGYKPVEHLKIIIDAIRKAEAKETKVMPFGKHKGERVDAVADDDWRYLHRALDEVDMDRWPGLHDYIWEALRRRGTNERTK